MSTRIERHYNAKKKSPKTIGEAVVQYLDRSFWFFVLCNLLVFKLSITSTTVLSKVDEHNL